MDNMNEYETEEKKKFQITRGMVILAVLALIIIIVIIIVIVNSINSRKPEYTTSDFTRLESRMIEETPTYLQQNNITLTGEEIKIDLKNLLTENGGSIESSRVKAAKICQGYVLASKAETEKYESYIKCGKYYTTKGYVEGDNITKPTTTKKDTQKPDITLIGEKEVTINQNDNYEDAGAKATDNVDGDITSKIKISGTVDITKPGTYTLVYSVTDKAGNKAEVKRNIIVKEFVTTTTVTTTVPATTTGKKTTTKRATTKPVITTTKKVTTPPKITLKVSGYMELNVGSKYSEPGYTATDAMGLDITSKVIVSGNVDTNVAGTYTIRYSVTDSYGNNATVTRTIKVKSTYIKLNSISLTPNQFNLSVGETKTFTVSYSPRNATNKNVTWSSSDTSVVTVTNGAVRGVRKGSATITVLGADGTSYKAIVVVK